MYRRAPICARGAREKKLPVIKAIEEIVARPREVIVEICDKIVTAPHRALRAAPRWVEKRALSGRIFIDSL